MAGDGSRQILQIQQRPKPAAAVGTISTPISRRLSIHVSSLLPAMGTISITHLETISLETISKGKAYSGPVSRGRVCPKNRIVSENGTALSPHQPEVSEPAINSAT